MSHPMHLRRLLRAVAFTLTVGVTALAVPATALADGQLDGTYNGTGFHVGSAGEGTIFSIAENRIPMVVQADGKIVAGGARAGAMTLVRYNANGSLDTSFGSGGFATRQFGGTPTAGVGNSGAVAMALDGSGNILVAGYGGAQSMVMARFTPAASTARAPSASPRTSSTSPPAPSRSGRTAASCSPAMPATATPRRVRPRPAVIYGQRAIVTLPASGNARPPAAPTSSGGLSLGSAGVIIDGLNTNGTVTDPSLAGRYYDAAVALPDNRYVVATTNGPDGTAYVQRYTAASARRQLRRRTRRPPPSSACTRWRCSRRLRVRRG